MDKGVIVLSFIDLSFGKAYSCVMFPHSSPLHPHLRLRWLQTCSQSDLERSLHFHPAQTQHVRCDSCIFQLF